MSQPPPRTLADMWVSYARLVLPPGTSATAIRNTQLAFYGGAAALLAVITPITDARRLNAIARELERFSEASEEDEDGRG